MFENVTKMHGKDEFSKIKRSICKSFIEAANICNILPKWATSDGLIVVKFKRDLKYCSHVHFQPYQELAYMKSHNKFYAYVFIAKGPCSEFLILLNFKEKIRVEEMLRPLVA